jgi:hypothetical protein
MWSNQTSINGVVLSEKNQWTSSLSNDNLVLIIKNDGNYDDIYHLRLKMGQDSFPIRFNITDVKEIKHTGNHLLTLLIYGLTHRLLWEGVLFRQNLIVNRTNHITFIVKDVCKWDFNIVIYRLCFSN